ncbi:MAG: anti-sigma factor [Patulibacter minatonensis]
MIGDRDLLRHLEDGGDDLYDRPEPPALDLAAITGQPQQPAAAARPAARRTWQLRPLVVTGGAAACLAIGALAGTTLQRGDGGPQPTRVAAQPTTPPTTAPARRNVTLARFDDTAPRGAIAEASIFTATDGRTVDLRVSGLPQPRKGEFYELWVLGEGKQMISLGIVRVDADGAADVRMPLPVSLRRFPVFDLSLEASDGNPEHSGHSILRSAAAA